MSMMSGMSKPFETGETVASFKEYEAAQKAVSSLIAGEVPAADIAIVGTALRTVEKVTGRLGYAQAAWTGALNGALLGLLFVAMIAIWNPGAPFGSFAGYLLVAVALGMLLRIATYAMVRRRRDFASVTQVSADHYEVTVLSRSYGKARQVLGGVAVARPAQPAATPVAPPVAQEPPRFGVRVDPSAPTAAPAVPPTPVVPQTPVWTPEGDASSAPVSQPEAPKDPDADRA